VTLAADPLQDALINQFGLADLVVDMASLANSVTRFREQGIVLPTFGQLADPSTIDPATASAVAAIDKNAPDPKNLWRVHWYNDISGNRVEVPDHVVLTKELVSGILKARRGRSLFLIDIAVPRDVDPAVNELENVYLYDIDELQGVVDSSLEERKAAADKAGAMLETEVKGFDFWRQTLTIAPTIAAMSDRLHDVGRAEIERFKRRMQGMTPEQEKAVEELVRGVVQKILHPAIRTLKGSLQRGRASDVASLYHNVFDLGPAAGGAHPQDGAPTAEGPEPPRGPHRIVQGGRE